MRRKSFIAKWTPERIITLTIIVGCMLFIAFGIDSEVKSVWAMAVGWIIRSLYMDRKYSRGGKSQ